MGTPASRGGDRTAPVRSGTVGAASPRIGQLFPCRSYPGGDGPTLGPAGPHHVAALQLWLRDRPWSRRFRFHLVGSLLDGAPAHDLDVALGPPPGGRLDRRWVETALVGLRRFGVRRLGVRLDALCYAASQEEIRRRAHDGERFALLKLRSPYWQRRVARGAPGVAPIGRILVRIERRLCETNYYDKLPFGLWRGRWQRVLRPGRPLL